MYRRAIFFVILIATSSLFVQAQTPVPNTAGSSGQFANTWLLGANIGPDFYYGDLSNYKITPQNNVNIAGSVHFGRQFSNVFGLRLQLLFGGIRGMKHYKSGDTSLSQSFTGNVLEFNLNATINFSNFISPYKPSRRFFVYGTIGIGVSNWMTNKFNPAIVGEVPSGNTSQWRSGAVIPFGLGAFYKIGKKVNVGLEWTFRMVFSDMMDQTIGGFKFDIYDYLAVGVTINLGGSGKKSPRVLDYTYPAVSVPVVNPIQHETSYPQIEPPAADLIPGDYIYSVQVCAYDRHTYNTKWIRKHYHIAQPVRMEKEGSMERFLVGNYKDLEYARELCQTLIKQGIHDAFVVAYKNGVRDHTVTP